MLRRYGTESLTVRANARSSDFTEMNLARIRRNLIWLTCFLAPMRAFSRLTLVHAGEVSDVANQPDCFYYHPPYDDLITHLGQVYDPG